MIVPESPRNVTPMLAICNSVQPSSEQNGYIRLRKLRTWTGRLMLEEFDNSNKSANYIANYIALQMNKNEKGELVTPQSPLFIMTTLDELLECCRLAAHFFLFLSLFCLPSQLFVPLPLYGREPRNLVNCYRPLERDKELYQKAKWTRLHQTKMFQYGDKDGILMRAFINAQRQNSPIKSSRSRAKENMVE
ncbi:hypothetical protein RJ035_004476 [Blastomyces gilchristii]